MKEPLNEKGIIGQFFPIWQTKGGLFMKSKKTLAGLLLVVSLCSFLSFNAFAQDDKSAQIKHAPITQQLITMVEHNSELKKMLIESIEIAQKINPDKLTNPAQTLEEYYIFMDWAAKALPWSILPRSAVFKIVRSNRSESGLLLFH